MPRVTQTEYLRKTKRNASKAFFAGFKKDSDAIMAQCFELDWSRSKIGRIVGEHERHAVHGKLQSCYRKIVSLYRFVSATGVTGATGFGVSQIEASDALASAGLVDGTATRIADVDRLYIACKVMPVDMKKGMVVRQDKTLVRYQFLELLLRLADQRYGLDRVLAAMADMCDVSVAKL